MRFLPFLTSCLLVFFLAAAASRAQEPKNIAPPPGADKTADAVLQKAIESLGGERYLHATSEVSHGRYSMFRDRTVVSFQSFTDIIVFPDKERTEFKGNGSRTIQANTGDTGWVYDGDQKLIKVQNEAQVANFKLGIRASIDYLLKGPWRGDAELSYIGKRAATLGKRNNVVKLAFKDGFTVEFEFAEDGLPQKALYNITAVDGETIKEEDRYAQFVDLDGVKAPFIIDRYRNGSQVSRINYESIEFNRSVPEKYFAKPSDVKDAGKELKF